MTAAETAPAEYYDRDTDCRPLDSPKMMPKPLNLCPSVSPSPSPSPPPDTTTNSSKPTISTSNTDTAAHPDKPRSAAADHQRNPPRQSDAVLLQYMGGPTHVDVSRAVMGIPSHDPDDDALRDNNDAADKYTNLASLALNALRMTTDPISAATTTTTTKSATATTTATVTAATIVNASTTPVRVKDEVSSGSTPISSLAPAPTSATAIAAATATSREPPLHRQSLPNGRVDDASQTDRKVTSPPLRSSSSQLSPTGFPPLQPHGELAPIQQRSPQPENNNLNLTLPSISALHSQLSVFPQGKEASALPETHGPSDHRATFSAQSPTRLPPLSGHPGHAGHAISNHASPPPPPQPKSPNETFRRELPSPGRPNGVNPHPNHNAAHQPFYYNTDPRRLSQPDGVPYATPDTSSSTANTPSTAPDPSTPAASVMGNTPIMGGIAGATGGVDRMSIDGLITNNHVNQVVEGFKCTFPSCNAPPFQTQYLLNSHANVHSSNRPHYCAVKGCPRSEGGKGFKRKNEMIRHGLVHESPGYVCPFCVGDREHKYPRPDNLQRHVRVHHVDKSKDDPALRDVLAQRPDGPNRGRRRRGGTH